MTGAERQRLARMLGMLGSEHAGERASAGLQAEAFRKRYGLTWEAMLALPPVEPPPPEPPPPKPTPAGEWINVYRPSMSISMKIWWASIWLFIFGWALGSVEMGIRWMVSG